MGKSKTLESFFKRKATENPEVGELSSISSSTKPLINDEQHQSKMSRVEKEEVDISLLEKDPGMRPPIWQYPVDQCDEIRKSYIKNGPYQPCLTKYPASGKHPRRFQFSWFQKFPSWLEYSLEKDAAFCLPCYLFSNNSASRNNGQDAFTDKGFRAWKKVGGKNCAFLSHMGSSPNSLHNVCVKRCDDLMAQTQRIENVFRQYEQIIANNRLWLKASVMAVRWLTFQGCAFGGYDENFNSLNRGNFIELIELLASCNQDISNALQNAPENAQYISPSIQKEILCIFARRIRAAICEEIGDSKFCLIIDEARDDSNQGQMAVVFRFVSKDGYVQERFFDIVHVSDTSSLTLKNKIDGVLSSHNLSIQNLRGQGYDGASNVRDEWNGLQALFLKDCPYAYYIQYPAHRFQLALIAAAREVSSVHHFFTKLELIVNVVTASPKRFDQSRFSLAPNTVNQIANQEIQIGSEHNEVDTLQWAADTRWGSHLNSIQSLLCMFEAICEVLQKTSKEGNYSLRGDSVLAYDAINSFDFIFLLHLMRDLLEISHDLCQALECISQDILNAMTLVSTTKNLIQRMKEFRWEDLLKEVISFCEKHEVNVPDMNARYAPGRGLCHSDVEYVSIEHHYRVNLFIATIDTQLQEINSRFNENTVELLTLSAALDPRDNYKLLNVDHICELVTRFYPEDFTEQEKLHLRIQAEEYGLDVPQHSRLKHLLAISELCQGLVETGKSEIYHLIYRLLRLVLTLPVSTAANERSFSALNMVKNRLGNKMEDEFLADFLVTCIERNIAEKFDFDSIIDEFIDMKEHCA
ncbi:uncharacterized protein LOC133302645 [Gastrolobium bilobum]|uniref:uncharacterized protein LOC133302645 n=1 Tax=Gastrolobium bilobum TaxID=150636 RepID=UPI002AB264E4|nr:uncharacterized protein LOC133302645 [Gastrolobium bilobum]